MSLLTRYPHNTLSNPLAVSLPPACGHAAAPSPVLTHSFPLSLWQWIADESTWTTILM